MSDVRSLRLVHERIRQFRAELGPLAPDQQAGETLAGYHNRLQSIWRNAHADQLCDLGQAFGL